MMNCSVLCLCVLLVARATWGANILYLAMTASPSHTIWDKTLALALKEKHHVTFVTNYKGIQNSENFTTIILEGVSEQMHEDFVLEDLADSNNKIQVDILFEWMHTQSQLHAKTKGLQSLLKRIDEGETYDLIIWDTTTAHFMYPIIEKLNFPPVIATSAFGLQVFYTYQFGIDLHTSYIPLWMMSSTDKMSFYERLQNFIYTMYALYKRQYEYLPAEQKLAEQVFGKNITSFDKMEKHISFLFSNSDPIFDYPLPSPPSVIHVGGLHIKRVEELPKDLKDYLDNSKHGVILFCLGTNVRSDNLGIKQREALLSAFSKLKQNVLWKFESDIENLPKNVIVRKWLPQNEILAHPNVKLFISHGGALSTQEAMYHGVPVVGIPFFADQLVNMHKFNERQVGKILEYTTMTAETIYTTINEVITNPTYKRNMQKISKRYRDQPQNPLERALFWVEYALRHGGGEHLQIASRDMSVIQLYLLDIWALIIGIIVFIVYAVVKFTNGKSKTQSSKNKTKMH